jgi:DNA polymerase II small subunit/DNA polymerase delta subunit B
MIGIFQRLFAEKKAEDDRIQDEYHSMLFDLASGKEVDEDDVRRLTIDSGRTEEQCSRDLETMIQRIAKVKEKQDWTKIQDGIPALQKKYDSLRDELNDVIARIQPQLIKLEWDLHAASDPKIVYIDDYLNNTCLNKSLIEREKEVGEQRKSLGMQKRTIAEDLSKARQHESYFLARLEKYNRKDIKREKLLP